MRRCSSCRRRGCAQGWRRQRRDGRGVGGAFWRRAAPLLRCARCLGVTRRVRRARRAHDARVRTRQLNIFAPAEDFVMLHFPIHFFPLTFLILHSPDNLAIAQTIRRALRMPNI